MVNLGFGYLSIYHFWKRNGKPIAKINGRRAQASTMLGEEFSRIRKSWKCNAELSRERLARDNDRYGLLEPSAGKTQALK